MYEYAKELSKVTVSKYMKRRRHEQQHQQQQQHEIEQETAEQTLQKSNLYYNDGDLDRMCNKPDFTLTKEQCTILLGGHGCRNVSPFWYFEKKCLLHSHATLNWSERTIVEGESENEILSRRHSYKNFCKIARNSSSTSMF